MGAPATSVPSAGAAAPSSFACWASVASVALGVSSSFNLRASLTISRTISTSSWVYVALGSINNVRNSPAATGSIVAYSSSRVSISLRTSNAGGGAPSPCTGSTAGTEGTPTGGGSAPATPSGASVRSGLPEIGMPSPLIVGEGR